MDKRFMEAIEKRFWDELDIARQFYPLGTQFVESLGLPLEQIKHYGRIMEFGDVPQTERQDRDEYFLATNVRALARSVIKTLLKMGKQPDKVELRLRYAGNPDRVSIHLGIPEE